jgi:hypothetical protein
MLQCDSISGMDDSKLIEELQEKVRDAAELLRRRREALAALQGKSGAGKSSRTRGFRPNSIPAVAYNALKGKQPLSLEDLTAAIKGKTKASVKEPRDVSVALSKYVRDGKYFVIHEDGKYGAK